jgi:hypothetical protein
MKKIGIVIAAFALVAYVIALPYITLYQMKKAVDNHDSEALSSHIDFPSVRESIKDQLNAKLMDKMQGDDVEKNPFAALGMAFAGTLVDKMVDAYVTPTGIAQLMEGENPYRKKYKKDRNVETAPTDGSAPASEASPKKDALVDVDLSYKANDRFEVLDQKQGTRFVLRRQGLEWKLAEVILPDLQ